MNLFYLAAGLIAAATGVMHGRWGEKTIIAEIKEAEMTDLAKAGFHIVWHQVTAMLIILGTLLLVLSLINFPTVYESAVVLTVTLLVSNIFVFLIVSRKIYPDVIRSTWYPVFNSVGIIVLTLLGFFL